MFGCQSFIQKTTDCNPTSDVVTVLHRLQYYSWCGQNAPQIERLGPIAITNAPQIAILQVMWSKCSTDWNARNSMVTRCPTNCNTTTGAVKMLHWLKYWAQCSQKCSIDCNTTTDMVKILHRLKYWDRCHHKCSKNVAIRQLRQSQCSTDCNTTTDVAVRLRWSQYYKHAFKFSTDWSTTAM